VAISAALPLEVACLTVVLGFNRKDGSTDPYCTSLPNNR